MALFNIPSRPSRQQDDALIKKASTVIKQPTMRNGGLLEKIELMKSKVESSLGQFKDEYVVLQDVDSYSNYISSCVCNGIIAIDTETTGLDPISDKIVGLCLYTPNERAAYVPINHRSYITGERIADQLTEEEVSKELIRLKDSCKVIMFNAGFDVRVLRNQLKVYLDCYWDCYLAARIMNENEGEGNNGLKALHKKYVLDGKGDAFSFGDLFEKDAFDVVPIKYAYLYAAHDAIITYELYDFQKQYVYYDEKQPSSDRNGMNGASWVFLNIEMPCVKVVADMEDRGVCLDLNYSKELSVRYNALLEEAKDEFYKVCANYKKEIDSYNETAGSAALPNPININSTVQLKVLLYGILGITSLGDKSTDSKALKQLKHPVCDAILKYRGIKKLLSTYIDKLPKCINPKDGRLHCKFNQYGADTGRFSSNDPNLQNIPSHNKDVRKMFKATDGYVLMSSDYSQQEPKVMTQMCQDPKMIKAYQEGKDLYAEIAALSFNTTYENCLEFRPDGTTNPEGKARRSQAKSILLGVLYGRGVSSIAEQLGTTTEKAQQIKDSVFKGFPAIPKFEKDSLNMAYELGYVTTLWGRKRRLPNLQLDEFEFSWKDRSEEVDSKTKNRYLNKLKRSLFNQRRIIINNAKEEGLIIVDNSAKIAEARRQCVNSRIQGSAADMSKLAMIKVGNDSKLKELGFRLLIPVHDELIGECPIDNASECKQRFAMLMAQAAGSRLTIPIKCDVEVSIKWYGESLEV